MSISSFSPIVPTTTEPPGQRCHAQSYSSCVLEEISVVVPLHLTSDPEATMSELGFPGSI
jgi:hypothetical protein